jgi:hypothetical protein
MLSVIKRVLESIVTAFEDPQEGPTPNRIQELRIAGFRVHHNQGRWCWYRMGYTEIDFSKHYHSEQAAWTAAELTFKQKG